MWVQGDFFKHQFLLIFRISSASSCGYSLMYEVHAKKLLATGKVGPVYSTSPEGGSSCPNI